MSSYDLVRLKKLFTIMLPILASQLSIVGMQAFDVAMSGHAGADELAGSSVGSSIIVPIISGAIGFLTTATPIIAHLIGGKKQGGIGSVVKTGLILALLIEFILLILYFSKIDWILNFFALTNYVHYVAKYYLLAVVIGLGFGLLTFPLRSLVETFTSTSVAMKIYFLALPINAFFNYTFIFGHFGFPRLGGIGAGIATAMTYFLIFLIFISLIRLHPKLSKLEIYHAPLKASIIKEYIHLGLSNSLGIFMEAAIFGFILIFVSKFGTEYTAAHQVAMNVANICYMVPLSFSMALTIIIGIEVGGHNYQRAYEFNKLALKVSFLASALISIIAYCAKDSIAHLYANDPILLKLIPHFLIYVIIWQIFDSIATPTIGILRGYKDIKIPSCINMLSYWLFCFPVGLYLDLVWHNGAFSYWQSLVLGIFCAGLFLGLRLQQIQNKYKKY